MELYLDTTSASDEVFNKVRDTYHRSLACLGVEDVEIPMLYHTKHHIEEITGAYSMKHDMCINTCMAYTGPLKDLKECTKCGSPRYGPKIIARTGVEVLQCQFDAIPLGPQIQALWSSVKSANAIQYRRR